MKRQSSGINCSETIKSTGGKFENTINYWKAQLRVQQGSEREHTLKC